MRKIANVCLAIALLGAVVAIWAKSPSTVKHAQAIPAPTKGITALELEQQIDVTKLPVLDVPDID